MLTTMIAAASTILPPSIDWLDARTLRVDGAASISIVPTDGYNTFAGVRARIEATPDPRNFISIGATNYRAGMADLQNNYAANFHNLPAVPILFEFSPSRSYDLWIDGALFVFSPVDWDRDEQVTSQDFFEFVADYQAADRDDPWDNRADFNGDWRVNTSDFYDFLDAFFGGTP